MEFVLAFGMEIILLESTWKRHWIFNNVLFQIISLLFVL